VSERHMLVYVENDVQPGGLLEEFLGAPLEAGYHLMDVFDRDDPACDYSSWDCLREAPGRLDTELQIRIDDHEALDFPDWG
jgi:hypothetical protein